MMTKEEVAEIVAYCEEHKISYKRRLSELGISPWTFYDAKRKYAPTQEGEGAGEFLQLIPGGTSFRTQSNLLGRAAESRKKQSGAPLL